MMLTNYAQQRMKAGTPCIRWHQRARPHVRYPATCKATGDDFFTGNYAPVHQELCTSDVAISGQVPEALLGGMYLRNGPNPPFKPEGGYHWYEGDGMIHTCWLRGPSQAVYSNQYVATLRLQEERRRQGKVFLRMCDMRGPAGFVKVASTFVSSALGLMDTSKGHPANTAIMAHADKLLALFESDMPYQLQLSPEGKVATVGHTPLQQDVTHAVTAHPKVDPETGVMHYYSYSIQSKPYLTYGQVSPDGRVIKTLPLDIPNPTLLHDFAITDRHAVFVIGPLNFDLKQMLLHEDLPFVWAKEQPARVGVLPLDAKSSAEMQWFELPAFYLAHSINAWSDPDGCVHLVGNCIETSMVDLDWARRDGSFPHDLRPLLHEVLLDQRSGKATRRRLSEVVGDLPSMHPGLVGRRNRYAYVATLDISQGMPTFHGIVKHDLQALAGQDSAVATLLHGERCFSGEALFVPRHDSLSQCASEDDGYLLCLVHDEGADSSELRIYDAASMDPEPLARLAMPQRVPYGFHGTFLREAQVQRMMSAAGASSAASLVAA